MGSRGVPLTGTVETTEVGYGYDRKSITGGGKGGSASKKESMPPNHGEPSFYQELYDHGIRKRETAADLGERYSKEYRQEYDVDSRIYGTASEASETAHQTDIRPARVHSLVHTNEASTVNRAPKIFLRGASQQQAKSVPLLEKILNAEWEDDPSIPYEVELCGRDSTKWGYGVAMTFYKPHPDEVIQDATPEDEDGAPADPFSEIADADDQAAEAEYLAGEPTAPEVQDWENDDRVVYGRIATLRLSPKCYVRDPDTARFEEALWHARIIRKPLYAIHADKTLGPRRMEVGATLAKDRAGRQRDGKSNQSPFDYVDVIEMWERREGGEWWVVMFAYGHDFFLRNEKSPYWFGHPFEMLAPNEDGEVTYPVSDAHLTVMEREAEAEYLSKVTDGLGREQTDTTIYDSASEFTEEDLNPIYAPDGSKWVGFPVPSGRRISDLITKLPATTKTPELMNFLTVLDNIQKMATGFGNNQLGQPMRSGTSASEAMEVAGFARARGSHKAKAVERFVSRIVQKRMALMFQFYSPGRIHRFLGPESAQEWANLRANVTKGDTQRGLRVRVEVGSMRPENDETRVQKLTTVLQLVSSNPLIQGQVDVPKLFKEIMKAIGFEDGASFLLEDDPLLARKTADMILQQQGGGAGGGGGGSAPRTNATPSSGGQANQQALGAALGGAG